MITLLADGHEEKIEGLVVPHGETILGWERKPHGWCSGAACIPSFRAAAAETEDGVDLLRFAGLLGRPAVADTDEGVLAIRHGDGALRQVGFTARNLAAHLHVVGLNESLGNPAAAASADESIHREIMCCALFLLDAEGK